VGKSKGGGGGGGSGQIQIPNALGSNNQSLLYNVFNPLGTYGSSFLNPLANQANWAANLATGLQTGTGWSLPANGLLYGNSGQIFSPFTSTSGAGGSGTNSQLGPFLSQEQQAIQGMQASTTTGTNQLQAGTSQLASDQGWANLLMGKGNNMLNQATSGSGLFPSQQAQITQAEKSQQSAVQQQLANEGLGSSTVNAQLQGQVKMSAAAAAGQLVQGNIAAANQTIGLGQSMTGLAQEQQKINLATQQALYSQFSGIASLSQSEQAQLWSEAQQGYGTLGQMMNSTLNAFGYSVKTQEDVLQANETTANIQAGIASQQAQMAQQGASSMFGALGSLLGSGSGGGGLLGSLGGLFGGSAGGVGALGSFTGGGITGALGAGGAAAGAAGGAGGLISSIGSALGALFCEVARTVYGVDSPDWLLFRDWILFRAPKPVRTLYVIHAYRVSRMIKGRPIVCRLIRWLFNAILYVDKATSQTAQRGSAQPALS
jgi:hypothetical protein